MNKLTFEEWKKEYGLTELTTDSSWFRTDEEYKELLDNQEKNRYEVYCRKVDALNTDPHSNKTYAEAMSEFMTEISTLINKQEKEEQEKTAKEMNMIMRKLSNVEEKNRCVRVRMYDWLSERFAHLSKVCHEKSVKIDSPCAIKLSNPKTTGLATFEMWFDENVKTKKTKKSKITGVSIK